MPVEAVQNDARTSFLTNPLAARATEEKEEKTKAEIAREQARQPGPKELARSNAAPISSNEFSPPNESVRREVRNEPERRENNSVPRNDLVSLPPAAELDLFAENVVAFEPRPEPEVRVARPAPETNSNVNDVSTGDRVADIETFKAGSTRESEAIRNESLDVSFEQDAYREALQNIAAQPTPAKAGALLDLTV